MPQNLSNLPVGARVKFGKISVKGETPRDIIWTVVAKNHECTPAYPSDSVTLFSRYIIDVRCFDAKEPTNNDTNRQGFGNNRYSLSNIDQWLNSDTKRYGSWYSARHGNDSPPTSSNVSNYAGDNDSPGFLNAFESIEKDAILDTTIRVAKPVIDGGGYEDITRKVFLPSYTELFPTPTTENNIAEGTRWGSQWSNLGEYNGWMDSRVYDKFKAVYTGDPTKARDEGWVYWLRTPSSSTSYSVREMSQGSLSGNAACQGLQGVRPVVNLSSTLTVSDTVDKDDCYTMMLYTIPSVPSSINVPNMIRGGVENSISWGESTDEGAEPLTYELECSYDEGEFSQIYNGSSRVYNHIATHGKTSVQYRVRAFDGYVYGDYAVSQVVPIYNSAPPEISGEDTNLGTKTDGFTQNYAVTDADGDVVTVTEAIDGEIIRSYTATLDETNTLSVTGTTWLKASNGTHALTITATDSWGFSTVRTYSFTKNVTSFSVETNPMESAAMPTRVAVTITKNIPVEAIYKLMVCNNGYDDEPTWEDATETIDRGLVYNFTNTSKTADGWAVRVRVTVDRNGGEGACYISAMGGNFE